MGRGGQAALTRRRGLALLAGGVLTLAACGGNGGEDEEPTAVATATPLPSPTPTPRASLGPVTWTTSVAASGEPEEPIEVLPRDAPVVFAAVEATALAAGETVTATWSINGTPVEGIDRTITIEQDAASGWLSFSLTWQGETLWPVGLLEVTITASSGASTSGGIQIVSGQ